MPEADDTAPIGVPAFAGRWFRVAEFDCRDGTPYPQGWIPLRLVRLVGVLDVIREKWGGPLEVVSGYRTQAWNARVGGAPASQHTEGRAADVRPWPDDHEPYEEKVLRLQTDILNLWHTGALPDLGGLGYYPARWIHVDVRQRVPSGHLAQWEGHGVGSER